MLGIYNTLPFYCSHRILKVSKYLLPFFRPNLIIPLTLPHSHYTVIRAVIEAVNLSASKEKNHKTFEVNLHFEETNQL